MKLKLKSGFGKNDELEIEVNNSPEGYEEAFRSRLELKEFPAVRLGDLTNIDQARHRRKRIYLT